MTVNIEAVQKFFQSQWTQKIFLVVFLIVCFWDGLWGGAPRADQLIYLYRVEQYDNIYDILLDSISWNRTGSHPGDVLLFRPILFIQLGVFFYLFKYNYFAWQVASLFIHVLTVLTLHSILIQGCLKKTIFPVLLSSIFGCAFLSSELVYWSHISGYITYCLFFLLQILFIVKFLKNGKTCDCVVAVFLGVVAEFTYELGVIQNIVFFIVFAVRYFSLPSGNFRILKIGSLFLFSALLYPVVSYIDFVWRGMVVVPGSQPNILSSLIIGLNYSVRELEFWFRGLFSPRLFIIAASGRASLQGFTSFDWVFWLSVFVTTGFFWIAILSIAIFEKKTIKLWLYQIGIILAGSGFLFSYAAIIAFGRAVPRGIEYVFNSNIYYAYIAYVIFFGTLAVLFSFEKIVIFKGRQESGKLHLSVLLCFFMLYLLVVNFFSTSTLGSGYRNSFSKDRFSIFSRIDNLIKKDLKNKNGYFVIDKSCSTLQPLEWLVPHLDIATEDLPSIPTEADVLFKKYSYVLNYKNIKNKNVYLKKISCGVVKVSSQLNEFGGDGLLSAEQPGWHAAMPVVFPQHVDIEFDETMSIKGIRLHFQDGLQARGPHHIEILGTSENGDIKEITQSDVDCKIDSSVWREVIFKEEVSVKKVRLVIRSNCGDPQLLTLRGLQVIE